MKKSKIAKFLTVTLNFIFICGIMCLFFLPKLYDIFADINVKSFASHSIYYKVAFYCCYIVCLGIIFKLIRIFNNIYKDNPFKKNIEISLKIIAVLFMILAIIIGIKSIFIPTILSFAVLVVTFIASLSFYVLSQIFKMAILYKDEIDHTI